MIPRYDFTNEDGNVLLAESILAELFQSQGKEYWLGLLNMMSGLTRVDDRVVGNDHQEYRVGDYMLTIDFLQLPPKRMDIRYWRFKDGPLGWAPENFFKPSDRIKISLFRSDVEVIQRWFMDCVADVLSQTTIQDKPIYYKPEYCG